jgi:hypothetical protein
VFKVASDGESCSFALCAVGVGHILRPTTVSKFGKRFGACADSGVMFAAIAEQLLGVGQFGTNPDSLSFMRCSDMVRSQHSPFCIIPHFGKITEDSGKSS